VKNQHSHDHRQYQGGEAARQGQSHALSPENRHFGRVQIAPVLPNSQNACDAERFRTVSLVVGQLAHRNRAAGIDRASPPKLPQQTPFAFELSNHGNTAEGNEYQAGDSEEATSGQKIELTRSVFA
jgi:hypothetical protein